MTLQIKPNPWSCSVTAFAMACDVPVERFIRMIGHDGSVDIFPELHPPMCKRGFHIQECIRVAWWLGLAVTPIEILPAIRSPVGNEILPIYTQPDFKTLNRIISQQRGVITGMGKRCAHAVAFQTGKIFDPDGSIFMFSKSNLEASGFTPQCAWVVT